MNTMGSLKLVEVRENEWMFDLPREADKATDVFFEGMEYFDEGNERKAKELFEKALSFYPDYIDALHHLSIISKKPKSTELLEKALDIGRKAMPKEFNQNSKLEWGWIENRPFLRAYHFKGLELLDEGKTNEAIKYFNQLITWNKNDNQGVREILADIYANNNKWEEIIELSKLYPDDSIPGLVYAQALALYKTDNKEKATKKLNDCIKFLPKCGKILLEKNPKKPKQTMEGYVSVGGEDQAYEFWESQGKVWQDKEIQKWLADSIKKTSSKNCSISSCNDSSFQSC